jgi:hypothetical protein
MSVQGLASEAQTPNVTAVEVRRSANFSAGVFLSCASLVRRNLANIYMIQFLSYAEILICFSSTCLCMQEHDTKTEQHCQELKEEVRTMLMAPIKKVSQKLDLIDDIQRLGVSRHFEKEIEEILRKIHENSYHCDEDLYYAGLRFRLLRQQGYNISCGKLVLPNRCYMYHKFHIFFH